MISSAHFSKKRGVLSLVLLCIWMVIGGLADGQNATDDTLSTTSPAASPVTTTSTAPAPQVGPAPQAGPATPSVSVSPTGTIQDPSTTTGSNTSDTKPTTDSPTTFTQPRLSPSASAGATTTTPSMTTGTNFDSTHNSSATASASGPTSSYQDATGKKLVFPITDSKGNVILQSASDMEMPTKKHHNSSSGMFGSSSKLPGNSTDSKGDNLAKKGAKPNSCNILASLPKSIIVSLSLGVLVTILA
ncbi:hypothetical protein Pst134EB_020221 [Puccinia striiformis f. sp. tritici]|nr:hypothetical protein Pst134EB_020221 [Puccinia striiformis f. sp. tritici]